MSDAEPLRDVLGRVRSPAATPGHLAGRVPRNKGLSTPPEILDREEVERLLATIPKDSAIGKRRAATVALLYWGELKMGQLLRLGTRHYNEATGELTVPGTSPPEIRRLDAVPRSYLDDWLSARDELKVSSVAPLLCTLGKPSVGRVLPSSNVRLELSQLREAAGLRKRVSSEGLRNSRAQHRRAEVGRFERTVVEYVNDQDFRARHPTAWLKWSEAHSLLETSPTSAATVIGHLCREAINEFSDGLVREHGLEDRFASNQTKNKVKAIFATLPLMSREVRRSLEALVDYWCTVSDLAQRQEHSATLTEDDSRRMVFQTMVVMREIEMAVRTSR
jgi:hypothetical protein